MKVRTEFVYPPIPIRSFDYAAIDDDSYEPGSPVGYGRTEAEAVADLLEQIGDEPENSSCSAENATSTQELPAVPA